jgi:hypothetical protein
MRPATYQLRLKTTGMLHYADVPAEASAGALARTSDDMVL